MHACSRKTLSRANQTYVNWNFIFHFSSTNREKLISEWKAILRAQRKITKNQEKEPKRRCAAQCSAFDSCSRSESIITKCQKRKPRQSTIKIKISPKQQQQTISHGNELMQYISFSKFNSWKRERERTLTWVVWKTASWMICNAFFFCSFA